MPAIRRGVRTAVLTLSSTVLGLTLMAPAHAETAEASNTSTTNSVSASLPLPTGKKIKAAVSPFQLKLARAQSIAMAQRGDRYSYGSAGPSAFDCSGLVYYSYRMAGIAVPRSSGAQAGRTHRISRAAMKPGDLIFFGSGGGVYHVGIFVGRTKSGAVRMLHSPRPGERVRIDVPWTSNWFPGTLR